MNVRQGMIQRSPRSFSGIFVLKNYDSINRYQYCFYGEYHPIGFDGIALLGMNIVVFIQNVSYSNPANTIG